MANGGRAFFLEIYGVYTRKSENIYGRKCGKAIKVRIYSCKKPLKSCKKPLKALKAVKYCKFATLTAVPRINYYYIDVKMTNFY